MVLGIVWARGEEYIVSQLNLPFHITKQNCSGFLDQFLTSPGVGLEKTFAWDPGELLPVRVDRGRTKGLMVYNVPSKGGWFLPEGAKCLSLTLPRYVDTSFSFLYSWRQPCVFWDHPGIHVWEEMSLSSNPPSYDYQIKEQVL